MSENSLDGRFHFLLRQLEDTVKIYNKSKEARAVEIKIMISNRAIFPMFFRCGYCKNFCDGCYSNNSTIIRCNGYTGIKIAAICHRFELNVEHIKKSAVAILLCGGSESDIIAREESLAKMRGIAKTFYETINKCATDLDMLNDALKRFGKILRGEED